MYGTNLDSFVEVTGHLKGILENEKSLTKKVFAVTFQVCQVHGDGVSVWSTLLLTP